MLAERVLYLSDANFNVTGLVKFDSGDSKWKVAERNTYTPYGVVTYREADWDVVTSSANANTTLYTGRQLDLLTALQYYRARFYDAGLERFISRDPVRSSPNLFAYCDNNPVIYLDPLGTRTCKWIDAMLKDGLKLDEGTDSISMKLADFQAWLKKHGYFLPDPLLQQVHRGCIGFCAGMQACDPYKGPYSNFTGRSSQYSLL